MFMYIMLIIVGILFLILVAAGNASATRSRADNPEAAGSGAGDDNPAEDRSFVALKVLFAALIIGGVLLSAFIAGRGATAASSSPAITIPSRPNFVVIMTDDQDMDCLLYTSGRCRRAI